MHSVLDLYISDVIDRNKELPREFTEGLTRAIILRESHDYISWIEFLRGFPIAVRQRKVLWDRYVSRSDLRMDKVEQ